MLHSCDVRSCRNVEHLFLGTNADNIADMVAKGRQARQRGEANGSAKLAEADILEIRAIPADVPHRVVAAMYGVSLPLISFIRRGERWKYID